MNPCPGICGPNAECRIVSHIPICVCLPGFVGDPFSQCSVQQNQIYDVIQPCNPNPCSSNAVCRQQNNAGACECLPSFLGNPYEGCRPECSLNSDCPSNRVCTQSRCVEPCPGLCGANAECHVSQHIPQCNCIRGFIGNPYKNCETEPLQCKKHNVFFTVWFLTHILPAPIAELTPCQPSPCGPNSQCREVNQQSVCSCLPSYIGVPPGCRPECILSSECPADKACLNQKCADPCINICGSNAFCRVRNHSPICACANGFNGDPFTRCHPIPPRNMLW